MQPPTYLCLISSLQSFLLLLSSQLRRSEEWARSLFLDTLCAAGVGFEDAVTPPTPARFFVGPAVIRYLYILPALAHLSIHPSIILGPC